MKYLYFIYYSYKYKILLVYLLLLPTTTTTPLTLGSIEDFNGRFIFVLYNDVGLLDTNGIWMMTFQGSASQPMPWGASALEVQDAP
jgi:hypothetical protein